VAKKEAEKKESTREASANQSTSSTNVVAFLKGTKDELAKVVWPCVNSLLVSRQQSS